MTQRRGIPFITARLGYRRFGSCPATRTLPSAVGMLYKNNYFAIQSIIEDSDCFQRGALLGRCIFHLCRHRRER